jgi:hypothetical protein
MTPKQTTCQSQRVGLLVRKALEKGGNNAVEPLADVRLPVSFSPSGSMFSGVSQTGG